MTDEIGIRPREESDLHELGGVLLRVHEADGYPVEGVADPEQWIRHPREMAAWTATRNGRAVGHVSIARPTNGDAVAVAWLRYTGKPLEQLAVPVRFFVDPGCRRAGAGGMLIATVLGYATRNGLQLAFDVMLKDRVAINMFESVGCVRIATVGHSGALGIEEPAAVYVATSPAGR